MTQATTKSADLSPLKRAYLAIEKLQGRLKTLEEKQQEPIAVVGIGCRFPGGANSPNQFWEMLRQGKDAITEVQSDRWPIDDYYDPDPDAPGKMSTRWGGFIDGVDQFDPHLFNISPREAVTMDPQQRLLLEVSWEALEHAGQAPDQLSNSPTGVFVGITGNDYSQMQLANGGINNIDTYYGSGVGHSMASGRISYVLGLQGPSLSIDTACSSSLVAIHLACQSLRRGECRQALAGGANAILAPETTVALSKFHMMSPDGRCKTFDARANGFVRGEGCGVVVLKRLSDAIADGDNILAVVAGTAVNQDGPSSGLTAPNGPAQETVIKEALADAGLQPGDISFVETHGTGTALGDPIEVQALGATLAAGRPADQPLLLGAVKTNIGHLESTAGIAGFIKLVLAIQHGEIPPNLHFETPNPLIAWEQWPLQIPTSLTPWQAKKRIGSVSSFGFSGTNAHLIVTQPPAADTPGAAIERPLHLLTLSAQNDKALADQARRWADHLQAHLETTLADAAYTANIGRAHLPHRLTLAAADSSEAQQALAAFATGEAVGSIQVGQSQTSDQPKIAFLFTGQGAQYPGMSRQLYETQPVFRAALDQCAQILNSHLPQPLLTILFDDKDGRIHQTAYTQPALFAVEYALYKLWRSWGVAPSAVLGHSVGEYVAAVVAGIFSLEDGLRLIAERGRLMGSLPTGGGMAAIFADADRVREAIAGYEAELSIAALNGPNNVVISGTETAVDTILAQFATDGVKAKKLTVSHAFHSPLMEPILAEFEQVAASITYSRPKLRLIANGTGQPETGDLMTKPSYWRNHIRQPVQFHASMAWLHDHGYRHFLEIGPHPTLLGMGRRCLPDDVEGAWLPSLRRNRDDWQQLLKSVGELYLQGTAVNWHGFDAPYTRQKLRLPTYPFQHRRYWLPKQRQQPTNTSAAHPLLGQRLRSAAQAAQFESFISMEHTPILDDHRIYGLAILPATAYLETAAAAAATLFPENSRALTDITIHEPLRANEDELQVMQTIVTPQANDEATLQIFSRPEAADDDTPWTHHVNGRYRPRQATAAPTEPIADIRARLPETISAEDHYTKLIDLGLQFGISLHGVQSIWRCDGEALGHIQLQPANQANLAHYQVEPALLDACLQVMSAALPAGTEDGGLFMPIAIDHFIIHNRPGGDVWSHATVPTMEEGRETFSANVHVVDENGRLLVELNGIHLKRASQAALHSAGQERIEEWLYHIEWQHTPLPAEAKSNKQALHAPQKVATAVQPQTEALYNRHNLATYAQLAPELDTLSADSILFAWQQLGWQPALGEKITAETLIEQLGIAAQHQRLIAYFLRILGEDGWFAHEQDSWQLLKQPPRLNAAELAARWQMLYEQFPQFDGELAIARRCALSLAPALTGQADPLQLLFPDGDLSSTVALYQHSPFAKTYNGLVAATVAQTLTTLPAERPLRVLEIGAGTGGTTSFVLPTLPAEQSSYVFTDMSPLFLERAKEKFTDYPFVDYRLLNIEESPASQGFSTDQKFDLIVAANVIHATADLRQTLSHVQQLLAPGGTLLMLEMIRPVRWIDLSFGLTDGWWRFVDDDIRPDYPLLNRRQWLALLAEMGWEQPTAVPIDDTLLQEQAILLARQPLQTKTADRWLIFADQSGVADELIPQLKTGAADVCIVRAGDDYAANNGQIVINPRHPADYQRLFAEALAERPLHHIVHLWNLDAPETEDTITSKITKQEQGLASILYLIQSWAAQAKYDEVAPALWLTTRQAQSVFAFERLALNQSSVWGMGKTIALEHPELKCACIDLDAILSPQAQAHTLVSEITANDGEEWIAYRDSQRYAARLSPYQPETAVATEDQTQPPTLQLVSGSSGVLDDLTLQPTVDQMPGPDEVKIRVLASGLNFRDVMNALAMRDDPEPLGGEIAGRIVAVGEEVTDLKPGDRVLAIAEGGFATYVVARSAYVVALPDNLNLINSATLPMTFLTADYALNRLAALQPGERVLIHAAAGGVGSAAVQLARQTEAVIFGTAGSPEKRAWLKEIGVDHVFDSRSLDFAAEIMAVTEGKGVDVVLNSLAGDFIAKSVSVLTDNGRFLEIGKRDIWTQEKFATVRPNADYFIIDYSRQIYHQPDLVQEMLQQIVSAVATGVLHPLRTQTFPLEKAADAFRFMAQARHVGKIVLTQGERSVREQITIHADASYLITGGLAGLGLLTAQDLAERGARHLVLLGRSAPSPEAQKAINQLRESGVNVLIQQGDVSQLKEIDRVFATIASQMPPLRGIIHSAGTLDDGVMLNQNWKRFETVMGAKVDGAWYLHQLSKSLPLDFFVLFSTTAALMGSPGQSNHAAANAFMDALAHHRRAGGLPALSINWGAWSEIGAAVAHNVIERVGTKGIRTISPKNGLSLLHLLMNRPAAQVAVMPVDWHQYLQHYAAGRTPRWLERMNNLARRTLIPQPAARKAEPEADFLAQLADYSPTQRFDVLLTFVSEKVAHVIGLESATAVDTQRPLQEMGVDSLMAVELRNALSAGLQLDHMLPATLVFDYPTPEALAKYLLRQVSVDTDETQTDTDAPRAEQTDDLLAAIEGMSDEEIDQFFTEQSNG